MTFRVIVLPRH